MISALHVSSVGRKTFGLGAIALALSQEQERLGARVSIWATDSEEELVDVRARLGLHPDRLATFPVLGPSRWAYSPAMERAARIVSRDAFSVVHQHGIWPLRSRATLILKERGLPTIIAAQGELDSYVLRANRLKRLKKQLALYGYAGRVIQQASCMHAVSEMEYDGYRDFGIKNPVAVIPNGIDENWINSTGCGERFRQTHSLPSDRRIILFLSRVTPKKGLPMLLGAMAMNRSLLRDWLLVIVGPDEFGHMKELLAQIESLQLEKSVRFTGPAYGLDRRDAFAAADIFALPSHSEGAPMAVLEALGAGIPVLTTHATPSDFLETHGCGWWTQVQTKAIAEALVCATSLSRGSLLQMGANGQELMRERYSWSRIAGQTIQLYQWLQGHTSKPDFVRLS